MRDLFDLSGKTALVTGGANGLGRMIALGLRDAGAQIIITSRKSDEGLAAAEALGGEWLEADLGAEGGASGLAARVAGMGRQIHILVNNAGRTFGAPLETFPESAWERVMTVNVQAAFTLVRDLLPNLRGAAAPDDPARVINIGSAAGVKVEPISAYSYAASKAALHHLTRVLAVELAPLGITVNTLVPGYFPTKMTTHIRADEAAVRTVVAQIPLGRLGKAEDIAGASVYLASRAAAYVTGTQLVVDGGLLAGG